MENAKETVGRVIFQAILDFAKSKGLDAAGLDAKAVVIENPPKPEMGDFGSPCFWLAKAFRLAPPAIAAELAKIVSSSDFSLAGDAAKLGKFSAAGPYLNLRLNRDEAVKSAHEKIASQKESFGSIGESGEKFQKNRRIMVEFSSPNTNKPLHLGHLRNDALGESVSRILKFAGADVFKVCIINNRGVHICKSMLAYQKFHEKKSETPQSLKIKPDKFVGDCYVEFEKLRKSQEGGEKEGEAEREAQSLLQKWEAGDEKTRSLWQTMNDWAIGGIKQTYARTGVSFDKFYFESETYLKGKDEILRGLDEGIFEREADGSVQIDLAEIGLDKKVLLRKDGTALYITQDIGTAIARHSDWPFEKLVYVVGNEQNYHFKVLFHILKKLGYSWADELFHLSYGMVNLPSGKMKSREGVVVDADDLIDSLREMARTEIAEKGREAEIENADETAEKIAVGALHYFLLQADPAKDMLFDPKESLSFNGNTGPYLQYTSARISAILRKLAESPVGCEADFSLLTDDREWALSKALADFPAAVQKAAETLNPSLVAAGLYEIAKSFAVFYHDCPILSCEQKPLAAARIALVRDAESVLRTGLRLILVPFLEKM